MIPLHIQPQPHLHSLAIEILNNPAFGWFPSSSALIAPMLRAARLEPGMTILEPSAGMGDLAIALRQAGATVQVIERDLLLRQLLFQLGFRLVGRDCLRTSPPHRYDRIVMNPPFSTSWQERGVDLIHIQHCYEHYLAPGGRLVSVVSRSIENRACPRATRFRRFLRSTGAKVKPLPLEVFWHTSRPVTVEASLVIVNRPRRDRASAIDG
ncbi:methyltransferase [Microcoleus sp. FACHB-1515]|uniref:methyltransferase n=1 Tax=Cyanophyceae TaxID=3028117 RepID=UPI001682141F|nr:methyltransferase [Microcoleus sp. FACHB-1515]MBD2093346.1 methyltransferase [Microcoleus sp. FACHB-1515]